MKFGLLLLIPLIAILTIGCQESTMSPVTDNPTLAKEGTINNVVGFSYVVKNPHPSADAFFEVSGTVQFDLQNSGQNDIYDLNTLINGQVYTIAKPKIQFGWTATKSIDQIDFSKEPQAIFITKVMRVEGTKAPLLVNMQLTVSRDGIQVSGVSLVSNEQVAETTFNPKPLPISVPVPLSFSYVLKNPYKDALLDVHGTIQFQLEQSPILNREMYNLTCAIQGQVLTVNPQDVVGSITAKSVDQIEFAFTDKAVMVRKILQVEGITNPTLTNPLLVTIDLMVTRSTVTVSNVQVSIPDKKTDRP